MSVYIFNPLEDFRWGAFVLRHPMASVFHTVGWVQALQRTYRYEPVVYTTSPPEEDLADGILLCRVCSRLTGRRMVSVPFADHCEPLTSAGTESAELMAALRDATAHTWQYVELRPRTAGAWNRPEFERTASFRLHTLDVRPPLDELFRRFHRSTMQRKVRRAEREGLVYEEGCSTALLNDFYRLLLLTRRRHRVPPQPIEWFANLIACLPDRAEDRRREVEGWSDSGHADDPAWADARVQGTAVRMPASTISAPFPGFSGRRSRMPRRVARPHSTLAGPISTTLD